MIRAVALRGLQVACGCVLGVCLVAQDSDVNLPNPGGQGFQQDRAMSSRQDEGFPSGNQPPGIGVPPQQYRQPDPFASSAEYPPQPYSQQTEPSLALQQASWTYVPPPPLRVLRLHDIVSIRVDEIARMQADGSAENRKNSLYDALLSDWIKFRDGKLRPDRQTQGDPRVQGSVNSLYRSEASIDSRESLSFNIAARIVDIRPNGNLVLEAHKTIFVNENAWETSLSGSCRSEDVGPDNVVLSRDLLDLQIRKNDRGRMRDGYKRGWFTRWFEFLQPF